MASNGDTRCAATSPGIKNTTSLSDETDRYLAAIAVFRTMTLTGKIQANKAGYLKITFADGGTENWFVTEPMMSDGGMIKQPGSLVKGDGIPKAKTCTA
ncbi:hypothetical protein [Undibacterium sp. Xuan67W]|uniref:hypothetical protein n=1 Tax=Undibacterium sp. Xuan67W TaxID=3413057 RepID=UPI003BF0FF1F